MGPTVDPRRVLQPAAERPNQVSWRANEDKSVHWSIAALAPSGLVSNGERRLRTLVVRSKPLGQTLPGGRPKRP
jgi:hypothetical protein